MSNELLMVVPDLLSRLCFDLIGCRSKGWLASGLVLSVNNYEAMLVGLNDYLILSFYGIIPIILLPWCVCSADRPVFDPKRTAVQLKVA
jgi:hypothetical protein